MWLKCDQDRGKIWEIFAPIPFYVFNYFLRQNTISHLGYPIWDDLKTSLCTHDVYRSNYHKSYTSPTSRFINNNLETTNPKANSYVKNSHEGYFNVNKFWSSVQAIFGHWINYPNQNARIILLKIRKITKQSIVGDTVLCQLYYAENSWLNKNSTKIQTTLHRYYDYKNISWKW